MFSCVILVLQQQTRLEEAHLLAHREFLILQKKRKKKKRKKGK
jgi:hypothetical protein